MKGKIVKVKWKSSCIGKILLCICYRKVRNDQLWKNEEVYRKKDL